MLIIKLIVFDFSCIVFILSVSIRPCKDKAFLSNSEPIFNKQFSFFLKRNQHVLFISRKRLIVKS